MIWFDLEMRSKVIEDGDAIGEKHVTSYYCSILTVTVSFIVCVIQSILCRNDLYTGRLWPMTL